MHAYSCCYPLTPIFLITLRVVYEIIREEKATKIVNNKKKYLFIKFMFVFSHLGLLSFFLFAGIFALPFHLDGIYTVGTLGELHMIEIPCIMYMQ